MKLLKLSLMLVLVSLFAACGDDDSSDCVQSDWVGTYTGTVVCDGASEVATITVTASGTDKIIIKYDTDTVGAEYDPFEFSGCDIDESATQGTTSLSLKGSIDGDEINFTEIITYGGASSTCIISGTK